MFVIIKPKCLRFHSEDGFHSGMIIFWDGVLLTISSLN